MGLWGAVVGVRGVCGRRLRINCRVCVLDVDSIEVDRYGGVTYGWIIGQVATVRMDVDIPNRLGLVVK